MRLLLAALVYCVVTAVLFGNPLQPIGLALSWPDRLGVPHWRMIAVLGIGASALVFAPPLRNRIKYTFRLPIFVILAILLPTVIVGLYADAIRHRAVLAFEPDEVEEHSFFASISKAPVEFQFFLHTAVLKDCSPYAWSYRTLGFYRLPPNVGVNVLPQPWIDRCAIQRATR